MYQCLEQRTRNIKKWYIQEKYKNIVPFVKCGCNVYTNVMFGRGLIILDAIAHVQFFLFNWD